MGIVKVQPSCLGDKIWDDTNANGIQDNGESGVAGVVLTLVDENGDSVKDINGNKVAPYTTKEDGNYSFCNLPAGTYQVKVTKLPDGYVITRKNQGNNDAKDSDISSFLETTGVMPQVTLAKGEDNMTLDGGIFKSGCIGSTIWLDKNANGIKEPEEEGIADVHVTLIPIEDEFGNKNNQTVLKQPYKMITTQNDGKYEFCNLIPGKYRVKFEAPLKDGAPLITTKKNEGDDSKDSDTPEYEQGVVYSDVATLGSKGNNLTVYAGYIQKICLGDKVWFDENLNGVQDKDELGVTDVKVHLTYPNGSIVKDIYGNVVKLTKTDKKGNYQFCDLFPARDYKIKFDIPEGYHPTLKDKGTDETKDSDAKRDGVIDVMKPTVDNFKQDLGIYCDCDDYLVNPDEHKELTMPALNILGLIAMISAVFVLVRREE